MKMRLAHDTWVIIADGAKYLALYNHGDEQFIDLRVITKTEIENPAARELSSDRPGRMSDGGLGYSALNETDWHLVEKHRFSKDLGAKLEDCAAHDRFQKRVIIADPKSLGGLRYSIGDAVRRKLVAEIDKSYTNVPMEKIEAALGAH
jgi:protein required for attachment to host cells